MSKRIVSLVGQRAQPVVSPIYSYLKHYREFEYEVLLIHTKATYDVALLCKSVLNDMGVPAALKLFSQTADDFRKLLLTNCTGECIFNLNPGMNWQIALSSLLLPESIAVFASDANKLYAWKLGEDVAACEEIALRNIGMHVYQQLNPFIQIEETDGENVYLSHSVKNGLSKSSKSKGFSIVMNDKRFQQCPDITTWINESLVWVREQRGYLHLLFDLDAMHHRGPNLCEIQPLNMFRLITSVFDPLNYSVTIITDDKHLLERASVEGIPSILAGDIKKWRTKAKESNPKGTLSDKACSRNIKIDIRETKGKTLFVCLGDNVEPTLTAIFSFMAMSGDVSQRHIVLFYDEYSSRICFIAKNVEHLVKLRGYSIALVGTDHRGKDIISYVASLNEQESFFNITPGTKMQTVALSVAARKISRGNRVFSIDGKDTRLVLESTTFPLQTPSVEDVITCLIPPQKDDTMPDTAGDGLWENILDCLCKGKLTIGIKGSLVDNKQHAAFETIDQKKVKSIITGQEFSVNSGESLKGGFWWEETAAFALREKLGVKTRVNVKWDWFDTSMQYSELDIVFNYLGRICVVSCKTKKRALEQDAIVVRSESDKRFGRFSIAFLAIPWEDSADRNICGVKILSPQMLSDRERLISSISDFITEKRTSLFS